MENHTIDSNTANMHDQMRRAFSLLSGKWKLEIMWLLHQRVFRFGELRKAIPGITQHMLTVQLRELEADGLVLRTIFPEVPLRVEYEMTVKARGLTPTIEALMAWWQEYGDTLPPRPEKRGRAASSKISLID